MKTLRFASVSYALLLLLMGCHVRRTNGRNLSSHYATNCTLQSLSICSTLAGRASNYVSPQNLPNVLDNRSLAYKDLVLEFILERTQSPLACYEFAIHLVCLVAAPPCNANTSTPLLLCPETCRAYDQLISSYVCSSFVNGIIEHVSGGSVESSAIIPHFEDFNCSDPVTYFQNKSAEAEVDNSPSSCTNLFSPESQELITSKKQLYSCVPLSGSICQALFPEAFDLAIQVPGRENREDDVFNVLAEVSPFLDDTCNRLLNLIACSYLHPPCNERAEQILQCEGECERIVQIFAENCHLEETMGAVNLTADESPFVFGLAQLNCSDTGTYRIPTVPVDNTSCLSPSDVLGSNEDEPNSFSRGRYIGVIAGGLAAGLILVLLAVIVTFLCTRSRNRRMMREMWTSQDVLKHLSLSKSLTLQLQGLTTHGHHQNHERAQNGGLNDSGEDVLTLPEAEKRELELQFGSSVIQFSSLTVDIDNCLGQGAFGKVYSGTMAIDGIRSPVAIKTIGMIRSKDQLQSFLAESLIMKDFKHPHILGLLAVCFDTPDHSPYIILPFMANGSVKSYLKAKRVHPTNFDDCPVGLKLEDLVQMCIEIAEGMKYLSANKFVHRDLAARNCMVNEEGVVLVGDFGLTRDVYTAEYYRSNGNSRVPVKWMPPEALNDGISNEKTDVWSYGVTCWEVFSLGRSPYPGIENHELLDHISTGGRLSKPTLCPDILYTQLVQCWSPLPEDRPSFTELCVLLKDYWDERHFYVVHNYKE